MKRHDEPRSVHCQFQQQQDERKAKRHDKIRCILIMVLYEPPILEQVIGYAQIKVPVRRLQIYPSVYQIIKTQDRNDASEKDRRHQKLISLFKLFFHVMMYLSLV